MRRVKLVLYTIIIYFVSVQSVFADIGDVGVAVKGSTLGLGGEVTIGISSAINARTGYNAFNYKGLTSNNDIVYNYQVAMGSFPVFLDWHPFERSGFRISPGAIFNNNKINITGTGSYTYDGVTYTSVDNGDLFGNVDFKKVAPYGGIGWGNLVGKGNSISITLDLGVVFQGIPRISLMESNGGIQNNTTFQDIVKNEIADLTKKAEKFKYYPLLSLGLGFKF